MTEEELPVLLRTVQDGSRVLRFRAAVMAAATTRRPGVARWAEMTVYRMPVGFEEPPVGAYVVTRVGRSKIAHRKNCEQANPRLMGVLAAAGEDARTGLVQCLTCLPELNNPAVETHVVLERTKYTVLQARRPAELMRVLMPQGPRRSDLVGMTAEIVRQTREHDPDFQTYWTDVVEPFLHTT